VRRYPTERLHDPGSDRALCSAPSPPRPGRRGRRRRGLGGPRPDVLRRWVPRGFDAALVGGGEREGGGGEEACGIPGGCEEDEDRGREVQGGVDEAQRGWEEEGGGSVGGRDP
jgi:hypothetical protein